MNSNADDMLDDYAISFVGKSGSRGKYFEAAMHAKRFAHIEENLLKTSPTMSDPNASQNGFSKASKCAHLSTR